MSMQCIHEDFVLEDHDQHPPKYMKLNALFNNSKINEEATICPQAKIDCISFETHLRRKPHTSPKEATTHFAPTGYMKTHFRKCLQLSSVWQQHFFSIKLPTFGISTFTPDACWRRGAELPKKRWNACPRS
jgi:hypothetical protein